MTYWEARRRNMGNEVYAELIPYMEKIVAEQEDVLDLEHDGELIDTAAEQMLDAEENGEEISTEEALERARQYEADRPKREAMYAEAQRHLNEEAELRGIEPLRGDDLLNFLFTLPDEEKLDAGEKLEPSFAKKSLIRSLAYLKNEPCFYDVHHFEDNKLWRMIVRFTDGELSEAAQKTLIQMNHNAHRTMLNQNKELKVVTFIVSG